MYIQNHLFSITELHAVFFEVEILRKSAIAPGDPGIPHGCAKFHPGNCLKIISVLLSTLLIEALK
jgi:hypothetical protein